MYLSRSRGQASVEYVAVVALLALVLAGAAAVVAAPGIPRSVVHTLRKGICIVGGDICDAADAKARGLGPCVTSSRQAVRRSTGVVSILALGHGDRLLVERLSDGRARVSYIPKAGVGLTLSAGSKRGRFAVRGGLSVGLEGGLGKVWEVPQSALPRFVARVKRSADAHTPWGKLGTPGADVHFQEGGVPVELSGELNARGLTLATGALATRQALGHRSGPDGTTWYYKGDAALEAALAKEVVGFGTDGDVLFEWRPGKTFTARTVSGDRRVIETTATVPASDPAVRKMIAGWLFSETVAPGMTPVAAGALARLLRDRGTTQRFTYEQTESVHTHGRSGKAGPLGAGIDRSTVITTRELVGAEVVTPEGVLERADCLGLGVA